MDCSVLAHCISLSILHLYDEQSDFVPLPFLSTTAPFFLQNFAKSLLCDQSIIILMMSISRQVFSSPFDITTRRRDDGVRDRNVNGNIMSDTRVVRRSIFNTTTPKPLNNQKQSHPSNPAIKFDRRLLGGGNNSIFANPILKVSFGGYDKAAIERKGNAAAPRTPPPVNGRHHVCIQADHESIDKFYD